MGQFGWVLVDGPSLGLAGIWVGFVRPLDANGPALLMIVGQSVGE